MESNGLVLSCEDWLKNSQDLKECMDDLLKTQVDSQISQVLTKSIQFLQEFEADLLPSFGENSRNIEQLQSQLRVALEANEQLEQKVMEIELMQESDNNISDFQKQNVSFTRRVNDSIYIRNQQSKDN